MRDIVDDAGTLHKHINYDAFGGIVSEGYLDAQGNSVSSNPPAIDQLFYFAGQEWDKDAKLQNNNARWYDPHTGRFLSADPSGLAGGDANLYRYVGNSPTNATDPTGLYQAGNPLTSLFAAPSSNTYAQSLGFSSSQLIASTPLTSSWGSVASALGNSVYTAASNAYPGTRAVIGASVGLASASATSIGIGTRMRSAGAYASGFIGSLWNDATDLAATVGSGLWAVATDSDARSAFGNAWQTERVQPLANRLYVTSKAYGHSDREIGDLNSTALVRPIIGEILPIHATVQALDQRSMEGYRTSDLQRTQDALNAGSGWILLGAGGYETARQFRTSVNVTPNTGGAPNRPVVVTRSEADWVPDVRNVGDTGGINLETYVSVPRTTGAAVDYDVWRVPGPNPNNLRQRVVTSPTSGEGGVYLKPQGGRTKIGSTGDFRGRYGPNASDGIEVEIPLTRNGPAADDSGYRWTPGRQARFDEEYVDRITPPAVRYRAPNNPRSPVDPAKWQQYRHIFGYGDLPTNFGL